MSAAIGAQTQLALRGPQDYSMWLAHSDWYPRAYSVYFPDHPWHQRMYRTAIRSVPVSASPKAKEAMLWAAAIGLGGMAIAGIILATSKK